MFSEIQELSKIIVCGYEFIWNRNKLLGFRTGINIVSIFPFYDMKSDWSDSFLQEGLLLQLFLMCW